jgi:hypothetical protein
MAPALEPFSTARGAAALSREPEPILTTSYWKTIRLPLVRRPDGANQLIAFASTRQAKMAHVW